MATMLNQSIIYVDPTISTAGDGQTPETALSTLPPPAQLLSDRVYLIRRTETNIALPAGNTTSTASNVYLLGMPMPGDTLWAVTPQKTRYAWGSDESTHAGILFPSAGYCATFANDTGAYGLHRLRFLVPNLSGNSNNNGLLCFTVASTTKFAALCGKSLFITNCEWRVNGIDLDDPAFSASYNFNSQALLLAQYFKAVHVRDCRIVVPGRTSSGYNSNSNAGNYSPFRFSNCQRAEMINTDIWQGSEYLNIASESNSKSLVFFENCGDVTFSDIRHRYVIQQSGSQSAYMRGLVRITGSHTRRLARIHSRIERFVDNENRPELLRLAFPVIDATTAGVAVGPAAAEQKPTIYDEDFDIDITPCWNSHTAVYDPTTYSGQPVVRLTGGQLNVTARAQYAVGYCRNIKIVVPGEDGIGDANVPFALELAYPGGQRRSEGVRNLTLKNRRGGALYFDGGAASNYPGIDAHPPVELDTLEGGLTVSNVAFLNVNKLVADRPDYLLSANATTLYINDLVADDLAWNNHELFSLFANSRVVLNRSNVPVFFPAMTTFARNGLIVNSDSGVTGKWKGSNGYFQGENYKVYRDGGAPSSLRLFGRDDARVPLQVGFEGFRNLRVTAPAPGSHKLVLHAMHVWMNPERVVNIPHYVVANVEVMQPMGDATGLCPMRLNSQTHGWWEADPESTWKHAESLGPVAPVRCVIPLDIPDSPDGSALTVDVRLEFDLYDPNGYFFLDPLPVFESATGGGV
jgi:hypothetical protein